MREIKSRIKCSQLAQYFLCVTWHRVWSGPVLCVPGRVELECSRKEEGSKEVAGSLAHQEIIIWPFLANARNRHRLL